MTDNELAILLRAQLQAGFVDIGVSGVDVIASYQPTSQGEHSTATVYFFKVGDVRRGWQTRKPVRLGELPRTDEQQNIETTYQFMARVKQDPKNLSLPTAADLLNQAAMILNAHRTASALQLAGVGIQIIGDLRNPYFQNASAQFEASPSFDFTVSHRRSIMTATSVIEEINQETHPMEVADGD